MKKLTQVKKILLSYKLIIVFFLVDSHAILAQDLYWIGGSGNWNDTAHWSSTTGGIGCHCSPTLTDNVHFDIGSFTALGQTVNINISASCLSMDWTGASNSPMLTGNLDLNIYGSLTLISSMNSSFSGSIYFRSTSAGNTITSAGTSITSWAVYFDGAGGYWTLQDSLGTNGTSIYLNNGTLNTNNNNLKCQLFNSSNSNPRSLVLGTSTVTVINYWDISVYTNMFLDADSSTINFLGVNSAFYGNQTYHDINFISGNQTITGNNVFNNVHFNGSGTITGSNVADNIIFDGSGNISGSNIFQNMNFGYDGTISGNNNFHNVNVNNAFTLNGTNSFDKLTLLGYGYLNGTNSFDSLIFTEGKKYYLEANQTQTINNFLGAAGTCTSWIWLRSNNPGIQANISKTSGSVSLEFIRMQDIKTLGAASFSAANSTDLGNNSGWLINPPSIVPRNVYWVGGTGSWNDGTHWSLASGDTAGACIPTPEDDVFFDANSFTSGSQVVTIDDVSFCRNINWTGAANSPTFSGYSDLNIYGSLTFINSMSTNFSGKVFFKSNTIGRNITSAGKSFLNNIYFDRPGGGWTLQDSLSTTGSLYLNFGTLNTNNKNIRCYLVSTSNLNLRGLTLGHSILTIAAGWNLQITTNMTFNADSSTINLTDYNAYFNGGDRTYFNLNFLGGGNQSINGNHVFHDITFAGNGFVSGNNVARDISFGGYGYISGTTEIHDVNIAGDAAIGGTNSVFHNIIIGGNANFYYSTYNIAWQNASFICNILEIGGNTIFYGNNMISHMSVGGDGQINGTNTIDSLFLTTGRTYTFEYSHTQSINYLQASGTCSQPLWIHSSNDGQQASLKKTNGSITIDHVRLQDVRGFGGAVFTATSSVNLGNSSGWNIIPPISQNLYWVGGTGNWNDAIHWSDSTGGAGGGCIPTIFDNVHFDSNSFSAGLQSVTIDLPSFCKNMDWTDAVNTPELIGSSDLFIYGSLTFISSMNTNYTGTFYFKAPNAIDSITSAGKSFANSIILDGPGSEWILNDSLYSPISTLTLNKGILNTNNQNLTLGGISSILNDGALRGINFQNSIITIYGSWQINYPTNYSAQSGTSTINFAGNYSHIFYGGNQNYYDVNFLQLGVGNGISNNGIFHNITFAEAGSVSGNITANNISFGTNGDIGGNINANDITFGASGSIIGTDTIHDVSFGTNAIIHGNGSIFHNVIIGGNVDFWYNDHGGFFPSISTTFHLLNIGASASIFGTNIFGHLYIGDNGTINGTNAIDSLFFTAGKTYTLESGKTQTINYLEANGTAVLPITIHSSVSGNEGYFSKSSGAIDCNYLQLQDNHAIGGATFTAHNSTDLGNADGWFIIPPAEQTLYWIGGSGNWNDAAHWSLNSGDTSCSCLPTINYNVHFDSNSFAAPGTVNIDAIAYCRSMDWTGVTHSPVLTGNAEMDIYGSLKLDTGMNSIYAGSAFFKSTNTGNTILSAGKSISTAIYFDGAGGEWILQDSLAAPNSNIYLNQGVLNTNNQPVLCYNILSYYSMNARGLNLGNSTVTIKGIWQINYTTNYSVQSGNSTINFISDNWFSYNTFTGANQNYYDVNFLTAANSTGITGVLSNGRFHNITFAGGGYVQGNILANDITFSGFGGCDGNINAHDINIATFGGVTGVDTVHNVIIGTDGTISGTGSVFNEVHIGGEAKFYIPYYWGNVYNTSASIKSLDVGGNATIYGANSFEHLKIDGDGSINGSNTIDSLFFNSGKNYSFGSNQVQIVNHLSANSLCTAPMWIKSSTDGIQATIRSDSGNIVVDYVRMKDMRAFGAANFIANNSIDFGNNIGWNFNQPTGKNLYWVGGTGYWYDPAHWDTVSGGIGGSCIPTLYDDVHFDSNSFSFDFESVTIDAIAYCKSMDWTGASHSPVFRGSPDLYIYGSLKFIPSMSTSLLGASYFKSENTGNAITTGGNVITNSVFFDGAGGEWVLQDEINMPAATFYLNNGTFTSNNQNINLNNLYPSSNINIGNSNYRQINLGSSVLNIGGEWRIGYPNYSINAGTSTINFLSAGFFWQVYDNTFYDINFINPGSYFSINNDLYGINNVTTFHNIRFAGSGGLYGKYIANKLDFILDAGITGTSNINNITVGRNATFANFGNSFNHVLVGGDFSNYQWSNYIHTGSFNYLNIGGNGTFYGTCTFDSLLLSTGKTYTFSSTETQTINYLQANGTCSQPTQIWSTTTGTQATINSASANIDIDYVRLRDIKAIGGAFFVANHVTDLGNNTGWNLNLPIAKNLFWVGGTGNWNDASNWSNTSGGSGGDCIPTRYDNVYFDANSFNLPYQAVYIDETAYCKSMDWSGSVSWAPVITGPADLHIYGSFTLNSAMSSSYTGSYYFNSNTTANTIISAGRILFNNIYFEGIGGEWILQDPLMIGGNYTVYLNNGTLNTNNQYFACYIFNSSNSNSRALKLGISTINIGWQWYLDNASGISLDADSSTINLTDINNGQFYGGGLLYHHVHIQSGTITGNNTFHYLSFDGNGTIVHNNIIDSLILSPGFTYSIFQTGTQAINYIQAIGLAGYPITIHSGYGGYQANLFKTDGVVCADYLLLRDINAIGGAIFLAGTHSIDQGNNNGWLFSETFAISTQYTNVNCHGGNNGTAKVNAFGCSGPFTYLWFNNATSDSISGLAPGNYTVTVTDVQTHQRTATVSISEPALLVIDSINTINTSCNSCNNGTISIHASGGINPLMYSIDGGNTFSSSGLFTDLIAGNYLIAIKDTGGCLSYSTDTVKLVVDTNLANASTLDFDGIDDFVDIGTGMSNHFNGMNSITVEFWINPSNLLGYHTVFGDYIYYGFNGMKYLIYLEYNRVSFWINSTAHVNSNLTLNANQWYHIAATWDGSDLKLYINGLLDATASYSGVFNNVANLTRVGKDGYGDYYNGLLDELRIWNKALIQSEIQASMNCEITGSQNGLIANYHFNQGIAGGDNTSPPVYSLPDASGNNNYGTLNNFTLNGSSSNWVSPGGVTTGTSCSTALNLKVFIEGYYLSNGTMIAAAEPISHPTLCDTIIVELRNAIPPYGLVQSVKSTIDINGNGYFIFPTFLLANSYYIVVRHRNSIEAWSTLPVPFDNTVVSYDFTNAITKAYGNNLSGLNDGNYAIYSGDISDAILGVGYQDGIIESQDYSDMENAVYMTLAGYIPEDITGDGVVESADYSLMENNVYYVIVLMKP